MKISHSLRAWIVVGLVAGFSCWNTAAASSKSAKSKPVDTTVRINSLPAGALVLLGAGEEFREQAAVSLGKTPLLRLMPLTESGHSVRITKAGYQVWNGKLTYAIAINDVHRLLNQWKVTVPAANP